MDDLISRQAVLKQLADRIEAAKKWHEDCVAFENETGEQVSYRALMDFNEVRLMVKNLPTAQPDTRLKKIEDLVDGTIDHFDRDDAMDLLYQIKEVLKNGCCI